MYIDTHVHLNNPTLYAKIEQVIEEAKQANVTEFIVVGYDLDTSKKAIEIAEKYDFCYAIIGFHPTEIKDYTDAEYAWLDENAKHRKVIGIGEIGYDFHWDVTTESEQESAFERQLQIAIKHHLPVSIHTRDAILKTYNTLKKYKENDLKGVIHSYSGSSEMATEFIKLGYKIGISGPITFLNNRTMKETVQKVELKDLISETDSPYLTPHPYRGKENGPKYIPLVVEKIAETKGMSVDEVSKQIRENVKELFSI